MPGRGRVTAQPPVVGVPAVRSGAELLSERVLEAFNGRANATYPFEEWGRQVADRIRERPDWTYADWYEAIRRAFAVAWWERRLRPGETPTPAVIFSSAKQVDSTVNVPDRVVEQAERARAARSGST